MSKRLTPRVRRQPFRVRPSVTPSRSNACASGSPSSKRFTRRCTRHPSTVRANSQRVAVTRHNRTLEMGNFRKAADEGNFFLRGFNYLMLFRKRAPRPDQTSR